MEIKPILIIQIVFGLLVNGYYLFKVLGQSKRKIKLSPIAGTLVFLFFNAALIVSGIVLIATPFFPALMSQLSDFPLYLVACGLVICVVMGFEILRTLEII